MPSCDIKYDDNEREIFYSGKPLSGVVQFTNEKKRNITSVVMEFKGWAKCYWKEYNRPGGIYSGSFEGKQTLIEKRETLQGVYEDKGDKDKPDYALKEYDKVNLSNSYLSSGTPFSTVEYASGSASQIAHPFSLAKGSHEYKFKFDLPLNLPTSIELDHGYIRYLITFKIGRKWKPDYEYTFPVTIIRNVDLNLSPSLRQPFKVEEKKFFDDSPWFIKVSAETPLTGYVAGERAKLLINVDNQSGAVVQSIQIELFQLVYFNSTRPVEKKFMINTLKLYEKTGVAPFQSKQFSCLVIIPAVDPSTQDSCQCIEYVYEIHVRANIEGLDAEKIPLVKVPIVIGTYPFDEIPEPAPIRTTTTSRPKRPAPKLDLPPPSYLEAMNELGLEELEATGSNEAGAHSLYPVLNLNSQDDEEELPPPQYDPSYDR